MNCIRTDIKEFQELLEATKLPSLLLEMRIAKWQEQNGLDNFPKVEDIIQSNEVNQTLKAVDILSSDKAKQIFDKGNKNNWDLNKILTELQIPKEQKQLILDLDITDREEIITDLLANYSYTVEINIAKEKSSMTKEIKSANGFSISGDIYDRTTDEDIFGVGDKEIFTKNNKEISEQEYRDALFEYNNRVETPTQHYSNLTVPGGTNYTENEIATPAITPSIKGHAQFATDKGIGWFRSDDKITNIRERKFDPTEEFEGNITENDLSIGDITKTRRILEVQSDLFQKGRNKEELINTDDITRSWDNPEFQKAIKNNQFLQLLNKDNNWINFFIKSIIQDSAKKGYEKVLFPSGNTASKIEGHSTLEEFKKQKEDRLKGLQSAKIIEKEYESYNENTGETEILPFRVEYEENNKRYSLPYKNKEDARKAIDSYSVEINQLKQELERVETEGFGALKPIYNFYENTVTNVLKKQGFNPVVITDEYGNTWNELTLDGNRDNSTIFMKKIDFNDLKGSKKNELDWNENKEVISDESTDYYEENNRVLFNNQQGRITVDEILQNILNNYDNLSPVGRELLEKSRRLIGRTGAKFQFVSESTLVDENTVMQINSDNNVIQANRQRLGKFTTDEVIESFIHELAHAQSLQALLNPVTFEEKEFNKLIKDYFNYYKSKNINNNEKLSKLRKQIYQAELDSNDKLVEDLSKELNALMSYGFLNEKEFVSEIYANKAFREELKSLDEENNTSHWKRFIESLRRLFGLAKTKETDKLIEEIIDYVQQDRRDYRGTNLQRTLFANKKTSSKTRVETVEDRLNRTLNKAKDNLDNLLERSKSYKQKNQAKGAKFEQHIQELISEIEKVDGINQWKGVAVYTKSMLSTIEQLETRLKGEDLTQENGLEILQLYKTYLSSYDLIDDVKQLITSLESDKIEEINKDFFTDSKNTEIPLADFIRSTLTEAVGKHDILESDINNKLVNILRNQLNNINYLPQVENDWKQRLGKEFKQRGLTNISQTEWVSQQMNTTFKDEIQQDLDKEIEFLLTGIGTDISAASVKFMDAINNNSRLVSITFNLMTQARERIIEQTREGDFKDAELFDKLVKEKGTSIPTKVYKNLLEFDSTGKAYYKGEYSIKFKEEYQRLRSDKENRKKFNKWKKENTIVKDGILIPTSKWKNDLSKLSKIEKDVLNHFINDIKTTDVQTNSIQSLISPFLGVTYYNLPSVTKSNEERILEGNAKGIIKDTWKDLTEIRPDDIGYAEQRLDSKGNSIHMLRVHYRGDISPDQQSLDLFTINRLNRINGINYKEKQAISLQVEAIKMVAKNKEYYNKTAGGISILNKYAKREKESTIRGIDSNEYKMINNLIEKNIYDLFHITYGKVGPIDLNKVISTTNGWVSSVGLSLNTFSAAANVLNAQAQIFLERVAGNHLTKGSVRKAHEIYTKDLANIAGDYSRPIKQSFVNQVNQMFDTFGGFTVQQQEFIKNSIAKTAINFESLQFMHQGGEHYVQSVMVMATLESIKVMDANNNYIDKNGNIVTENKAVSVLDMLAKDENGLVKMSDKVVYTTRSLNSKINEGGKEQLLLFVKKKIFDTMGNYDSNLQPEAYRHWWGKMIMLFRRYLIPQAVARFRGAQSFYKHQDNLTENDIHFNNALRTTEEGSYVSTARFLIHGVYPALRQLKFDILSSNWNELSDDKKAGIKRSVMELALTGAILPLIGMLAAGAADGDDDNEWLWTVAFLARRLESELSQFRDPREATKITKSPIPSLRIIEQTLDVAEYILPWNWAEIDDTYQSGKNKGELKITRKFEKLVPVVSKLDTTAEELYNGLNSRWGK